MKDVEKIAVRDVAGGAVICVKAVPRASRDRVVGVLGDCLKVATASAAEKGRANAAIAKTLAAALGINRRNVELVSGMTGPRKEFRIAGVAAADLRRMLGEIRA